MKYHIVTYGCQMNVHESEKIAGILEYLGYKETDDIKNSDIIVFNTCCIRDNAEKKVLGNIGAVKKLKREKKELIVCVVGCMTQQFGKAEELKKKYPFINIILGTSNLYRLKEHVESIRKCRKKTIIDIETNEKPKVIEGESIYRTSGANAWVNIMYGCNNFCTYCIVPYVRGRERSRAFNDIISEVRELVANGYKEITLLGQNVNSYGHDLDDERATFVKLLQAVADIDGDFRIRFMTSHPKDLTDDVIDVIARNEKICNNIHLPIQSGSNKILRLMNRHYTREYYLDLVEKIKRKIPSVGITTDIMVGFPYEEEEDFNDTLDLVKKARYSSAFTFIYSVRRGTKAAEMPQVDEDVKSERIQKLIKVQNEITRELSREYENKIERILVEDVNPKDGSMLTGRTDSGRLVNFHGDKAEIGTFVNVKISRSQSATLFGEVVK